MESPNGPMDPEGSAADVPRGYRRKKRNWSPGGRHENDWLSPTGYVAVEVCALSLALIVALGGAHRVGLWLLTQTIFDVLVLMAVLALALSAAVFHARAQALVLYSLAVAATAYVCGLLFSWYRHTWAAHDDVSRAIRETLVLVIAAYVSSIVLALLPLQIDRRNLLRLIVGVLLPVLLLVTSLVPFYHTIPGFIRTVLAILVICHLTYECTAIARRPHRLKFVLDLTLAFIVDVTLIGMLLLGA